MPGPGIRHKDIRINVLRGGALTGVLLATEINVNEDVNKDRSQYAGSADYVGDMDVQGWSGSITVEVRGSEVDDLVQAQIDERRRRETTQQVQIVYTEIYPDGAERAWRLTNCMLSQSNRSSQGARYTKNLDFQADSREAV